jgi:hypothetical protein
MLSSARHNGWRSEGAKIKRRTEWLGAAQVHETFAPQGGSKILTSNAYDPSGHASNGDANRGATTHASRRYGWCQPRRQPEAAQSAQLAKSRKRLRTQTPQPPSQRKSGSLLSPEARTSAVP